MTEDRVFETKIDVDLDIAEVRYLLVGGLNTAVCYVIYLLLLDFTGHNIAFTIDYLFGIVFSYFLQLKFVFQAEGSIEKFVKFPSVYVI